MMSKRKLKNLEDVSQRTYKKRKRVLISNHFNRNLIQIDNNDQSNNSNYNEELNLNNNTNQLNNENISFELDLQEFQTPSEANQINIYENYSNEQINLSNLNEQLNIQLENNNSLNEEVQFNLQLENNFSNMNSFELEIINSVLDIYLNNNASKQLIEKMLKIINKVSNNKDDLINFPKSFYLFNKLFSCKIRAQFYFTTKCCNYEIKNFKSLEGIRCINCNKSIKMRTILSTNQYFFRFFLHDQLKYLLENFTLKYDHPGKIFKYYLEQKKDICSMTMFIDDAPSSINCLSNTNLFIKVNNLECDILTRSFLNSCSIQPKKLDELKINFFLSDLIDELNYLYENGIFINRLNKKVYPIVTLNLFDLVARHQFMFHQSFSAFFGCLRCLKKGETCPCKNGHSHIYQPDEVARLRTVELNNGIFDLIENKIKPPPILGIKGRSPITKISYQNYLTSTGLEPMHLTGGIIKRNFDSFIKLNGRPCFMAENMIQIVNKRLIKYAKFTYNDIFKRKIECNIKEIDSKKWKTNQVIQFYFLIFPIVFEHILDVDVYLHNMILIYVFYNLWSKKEEDVDLVLMDNLIKLYLVLVEDLYDKQNLTPNTHQLEHIIEHYLNHGMLSLNNAFLFEHYNGLVKKIPKSSFGTLEQISEKSKLLFESKIKKESNNLINRSRIFKTKDKDNDIKKIYNDYLIVTKCDHKIETKDYFVMTNENRFFKIINFYKLEDTIFFTGQEFKIISNYTIDLNFTKISSDYDSYLENIVDTLNLDYIFEVELGEDLIDLNSNCILEKVLFCPKFYLNTYRFSNVSKGLIFRDLFKLHN